MQKAVESKRQKYVDEAFDKELEKHPAESRDALRAAFKTPDDKLTDEQKQLVAKNPSLKINAGLLYQYNSEAAEELKKDEAAVAAKRSEKPVEDFISVLRESGGAPNPTRIFHRGDHRQPLASVTPADLTIAAEPGNRFAIAEKDTNLPGSGRRLAWAKHLVKGDHPLLGRVLANRVWLNHFGRGIVDTPGEFGILGTRPTHPELLDWLACELFAISRNPDVLATDSEAKSSEHFVKTREPSFKRIHRLLMASAAYQQSSQRTGSARSLDMSGSLYSRFPIRRLDAEVVRDRMLAVNDRLNDQMFGTPIEVMEDFAGQVHVKNDTPRRSVYIHARRTKPVSLLAAFDSPVMTLNCDRRTTSTVAPQSLMLMNGDFVLAQSDNLAQAIRKQSPTSADRTIAMPLAMRFPTRQSQWSYGYGSVQESNPVTAATVVSAIEPTNGSPAVGGANSSSGARVQFTRLTHFTGSTWQGSASLPDPTIGWALIIAAGGHPGNDQHHAVIRRWTSPQSGKLTVTGKIKHHSDQGDGVRGRIVSSRAGVIGAWTSKTNEVETTCGPIDVSKGDTIDVVTDCLESVTSDTFDWSVKFELHDETGVKEYWDSTADFSGPELSSIAEQVVMAWRLVYGRTPDPKELDITSGFLEEQIRTLRTSNPKEDPNLAALTNLCQQLLISNEFLYVD
ncbi:MAG: DUF1553 domain-containing protein [Planctomycetes bacterium]|nr:DUF1553 domain-containing protein [Planctomycetota bacterium]